MIVAPDLQISWGHVGKSLSIFSEFFVRIGHVVKIIMPTNAPEIGSLPHRVEIARVLPNTYESVLVPNTLFDYPGRTIIAALTLLAPLRFRNFLRAGFQRVAWFQHYYSKLRNKDLWHRQLVDLKAPDTIFFPSADFLTLNLFLKAWIKLERTHRPRVVVRFINVLENMDIPHFYPRRVLFKKLLKYQKQDPSNLIVAVETHNYGQHLETFGLETVLIYYPTGEPIANQVVKKRNSNNLTIVTLGSARPDKGFEKLAEIIPQCQSSKIKSNCIFIVQGPANHWSYSSKLAEKILGQTRGVEILPGKLADDEIQSTLAGASIQLLPYFRDVYELRGSAMLFDGCDVGVPLIAPAGTGFAFEVLKYNIGLTFTDFDQIPELITKLKQDEIARFRKNIKIFNEVRNESILKIFG